MASHFKLPIQQIFPWASSVSGINLKPFFIAAVSCLKTKTFYLTMHLTHFIKLYGVRHVVKDNSDSYRGNLLLPLFDCTRSKCYSAFWLRSRSKCQIHLLLPLYGLLFLIREETCCCHCTGNSFWLRSRSKWLTCIQSTLLTGTGTDLRWFLSLEQDKQQEFFYIHYSSTRVGF